MESSPLDSLPLTASLEKTPRRVTSPEKSLALGQESPTWSAQVQLRKGDRATVKAAGDRLTRKAPESESAATKTSENYPKMSLTLSKMEEPRSAGLLSTLSVASSCSMSLRCSLVSFVGVSTRT